MKLKSFSLIEVLIASYVFMIVIMMVTSSFAMIRKSNENSDDVRITSTCARQVEDVFRSAIKSANFGSPAVMGIKYDGVKYTLADATGTYVSTLSGFATFEDAKDVDSSKIRIKTFVKTSVNGKFSYIYSTGVVQLIASKFGVIPDGLNITTIVNSVDSQKIHSSDCLASNQLGIRLTAQNGTNSQSSNLNYALTVKDRFFRVFADQATEKKYSNINLFVINDAKSL